MLDINIKDSNVITNEVHLGTLVKLRIFPIIVQSAIAIIIEAKNSIRISFRLHIINMDIIKAVIDNNVVIFKLNI